jgi:hypothetical protein
MYLNYLKVTSIRLNPITLLIVCPHYGRDGCLNFSTRRNDTGKPTPCSHCIKDMKNARKRASAKRRSMEAGFDRADPSSNAPVSLLSPDTMVKRYKKCVVRSRSHKKQLGRLELRLKETVEFSMDDDNVMEVLDVALRYCTPNAGEMRKRIIAVLIESAEGYSVDDNDKSRKAEIDGYVDAFSTTISNYALTISDKKGVVRFDSRVLRAALAFWLESPAAYERLKANSLEVYPSQSKLYTLQRQLISNEYIQQERRPAKQQA